MVENISENTKDIYNMHFGAEAFGFENAGKLRKYQTESESILWEDLKNKKLDGFKFRRQHPVSRFVVDFYCHRVKLVIEEDGEVDMDFYGAGPFLQYYGIRSSWKDITYFNDIDLNHNGWQLLFDKAEEIKKQ